MADRTTTCLLCGEEIKGSHFLGSDGAKHFHCEDSRQLKDASMLLRMAAMKLRKRGENKMADNIVDWLRRHGLQGSILRGNHNG